MPRAARRQQAQDPAANGLRAARAAFVKLERRLALAAWFLHLLGYEDNRRMLRDMKEAAEGFDGDGRSFLLQRLESRGDQVKLDRAALARYDENLRQHLAAMNRRRPEPITLRYFQHLALLFTEIFLDRYFNHRAAFVAELNEFVWQHNAALEPGDDPFPEFAPGDLTKLAYWMATGSGKTLLMHFNLRQFLHYNREPLDNLLLVTPNEGLTEQHLEEMRLSGIPCERFLNFESGLGLGGRDVVRVIEITKLVEEKRGAGVSVPVEAFEGNNLIFVDEGHKGSGGQAWRGYRDALAQTGFTFEYSATFGQALTAARADDLCQEYGKAIVFDYSYRYFYDDGYGKDFRILNLPEDTTGDATDTLLLANLLSFYQQQKCFGEHPGPAEAHNLEPPLWVFVGSSVNAVYTEDRRRRSDVLTVARFLHRVLSNPVWAKETIERILAGKSGLCDTEGNDVFANRFAYLPKRQREAGTVYRDILKRVFNTTASSGLHLAAIRGSDGELGLRTSPTAGYFGLIYIGDAAEFRKLVETDDAGIVLDPEDVTGGSLFSSIGARRSPVNVLIGAKKFIEGWSSWRVSNMGLLNIGRSEGSEIIQLFGRGVRLLGRDRSLKRSSALPPPRPKDIGLLETLEIFALRANYMAQFRDYLEREGVDTEGWKEFTLPIRRKKEFLGQGLLTLRLPPEAEGDFLKHAFTLAKDPDITVKLDLSLRVQALSSSRSGLREAQAAAGDRVTLPQPYLDMLDWNSLYLELLEHKNQKGYANLALDRNALRAITSEDEPLAYELIAGPELLKPRSVGDLRRLHEITLSILKSYMDKTYTVHRQRWESQHMALQPLMADDPNLRDYTVKLSRSDSDLLRQIESLIAEGDRLYREDVSGPLHNVHFDRHLYQPLLVQTGDRVKTDPPGLEESEREFVRKLRAYAIAEAGGRLAEDQVFLLRNLSRARGVGFFESHGFYPDFILWTLRGTDQRIVFIEPHGMLQETAYRHNDRLRLHERLGEFQTRLKPPRGVTVKMDAFTISATPLATLRPRFGEGDWDKARFAAHHILFAEDEYVQMLFGPIVGREASS